MTAATIALVAAVCPSVVAPAKGQAPRRKGVTATRPGKIRIAGRDAAEILKMLGGRREDGATDEQLGSYVGAFNTCDRDGDGKHTKKEYIEDGHYLTPRARRGIFRASDNNADGRVTTVEYVLNRILTDEAKRIVQAMDADKNGTVQKAEFLRGSPISDRRLGEQVFKALDTNGDGELLIPEYLRVWGRWARPSVKRQEAKVAARLAKLRPGRPGRPPSVDRIFKIMDRNKDAKLTKAEFRGPKHVFAAADVNEDGFLTRAELTEFRKRRPTTRPGRRDKNAARSQPVRRP